VRALSTAEGRGVRACVRCRETSASHCAMCVVQYCLVFPHCATGTVISTGPLQPHLRRDWAHCSHICAGTGPTGATSAPGLSSPVPHLRRDWAHPCHICAGTGPTRATSKLGSELSFPCRMHIGCRTFTLDSDAQATAGAADGLTRPEDKSGSVAVAPSATSAPGLPTAAVEEESPLPPGWAKVAGSPLAAACGASGIPTCCGVRC
jgi:hypothetical protein